jgi:hypothetical protein
MASIRIDRYCEGRRETAFSKGSTMTNRLESPNDITSQFDIIQPSYAADTIERQTWVRHKGHKICIRDFSNLYGEEALRIAILHRDWHDQTDKRGIRLLLDVTNLTADKELVKIFKDSAKHRQDVFAKVAAVGIEGLMKLFFQAINTFSNIGAKPFPSREKAMDWLAL